MGLRIWICWCACLRLFDQKKPKPSSLQGLPSTRGVSIPEWSFCRGGQPPGIWGQFELESGQFGPESIVQHHAAVYEPLHTALLLSLLEIPMTFSDPDYAAGNKRTSDTTTHAWHSSPFCSIHSAPTDQSDQPMSTLFSCAQNAQNPIPLGRACGGMRLQ